MRREVNDSVRRRRGCALVVGPFVRTVPGAGPARATALTWGRPVAGRPLVDCLAAAYCLVVLYVPRVPSIVRVVPSRLQPEVDGQSRCNARYGRERRELEHGKWHGEVVSSEKGYGFISQEGGPDVFVHYKAIQGQGYRTLEENEPVEFEVQEATRASRQ